MFHTLANTHVMDRYCYANGSDLILFPIKIDKAKATRTNIMIVKT